MSFSFRKKKPGSSTNIHHVESGKKPWSISGLGWHSNTGEGSYRENSSPKGTQSKGGIREATASTGIFTDRTYKNVSGVARITTGKVTSKGEPSISNKERHENSLKTVAEVINVMRERISGTLLSVYHNQLLDSLEYYQVLRHNLDLNFHIAQGSSVSKTLVDQPTLKTVVESNTGI